MLTKPLDAVLLQMKLMHFTNPAHALMRCLTPPDEGKTSYPPTHSPTLPPSK